MHGETVKISSAWRIVILLLICNQQAHCDAFHKKNGKEPATCKTVRDDERPNGKKKY